VPCSTLNIGATVLRELKRRQRKQRKPLGDIASELLAQALCEREDPRVPRPLAWTAAALHPKVDLENKDAVYRILDGSR
jgi:hypothetical protein